MKKAIIYTLGIVAILVWFGLFFAGMILVFGEPDEDCSISLMLALKALGGLCLFGWYKITMHYEPLIRPFFE